MTPAALRVLADLRAKKDLAIGDFINRPKSATMAETVACLPQLIADGLVSSWGNTGGCAHAGDHAEGESGVGGCGGAAGAGEPMTRDAKLCGGCHRTLRIVAGESFTENKTMPDGLQIYCRECDERHKAIKCKRKCGVCGVKCHTAPQCPIREEEDRRMDAHARRHVA